MHTESESQLASDCSAVELRNVSVCYQMPKERLSGLKEYLIRWMQGKLEYTEVWALRNASFTIAPGQSFGIIGKNGAGKSTMLKVIAKVLYPTQGQVIVRGQISPLLELGGGFHHELTGRENVYINGELIGISSEEIDERFASIVEFSELEGFIDAPIRTYSTGMVARLAFAVATCKQPDILLADEILSVGDIAFQQKCLDRISGYAETGSTILLVSHGVDTIEKFCNQAVWIDHGEVKEYGDARYVCQRYRSFMGV